MKKFIPNIFIVIVIIYLLYLIKPAFFGELRGTFKPVKVPSDYVQLEKFIRSDKQFFRTLWVPQLQRFSFPTSSHPNIPANDFFKVNTPEQDIRALMKNDTPELIRDLSIKYIIVPYDSQGEIFLTDRKYDEKLYQRAIRSMNSLSWVTRVNGYDHVGVYDHTHLLA